MQKNLRTIEWPEYIERHMDVQMIPGTLFLDLGLYDIPATVTAAVHNLAKQGVAFVSVHPSCINAALAGQIDGLPRIVIKRVR
jgi:orotidine-5'-phosphate decarboxylase